jgi:hypothetical protein
MDPWIHVGDCSEKWKSPFLFTIHIFYANNTRNNANLPTPNTKFTEFRKRAYCMGDGLYDYITHLPYNMPLANKYKRLGAKKISSLQFFLYVTGVNITHVLFVVLFYAAILYELSFLIVYLILHINNYYDYCLFTVCYILYSQLLFNSSTFLMAISTSCCIFIDL